MASQTRLPPLEPLGWSSWRLARLGLPELGAFEFGWYTDIWPLGEVQTELGPLRLLNPIAAMAAGGEAAMAIVARFAVHRESDPVAVPPKRTFYERYVAVDIGEEIAALTSLALGIRCRSGGVTREFYKGGDPHGRALGYNHAPPQLERPRPMHGRQLPLIAHDEKGEQRQVHLTEAVPPLSRYPNASQRRRLRSCARPACMHKQPGSRIPILNLPGSLL